MAGYEYPGQLRAIKLIQCRINFATGVFAVPDSDLVIHTAALDGFPQASLAAEGYPADSAMPKFRVRARIKSMINFPAGCEETLQCSETPRKAEPVESVAYCAGRSGTIPSATETLRIILSLYYNSKYTRPPPSNTQVSCLVMWV
jgi:hypothetical protein